MRIKRNLQSPINPTGRTSSPTMRISNGVLRQNLSVNETEEKMAKAISNSALVLTAGLGAGLSGQTLQDTGKMMSQGIKPNTVDFGGFEIGKFTEQIEDLMLPKKLVRNPITGEVEKSNEMRNPTMTKMEDYDFVKSYVDDYNKGVQIGNATVQLQAKASITDAKTKAEEQFNKDMISGNYVGALDRARETMKSTFDKYLSDDNVAPAVKENITKYLESDLANAQFDREYSVKLTNAISTRNRNEAIKEMDETANNLLPNADINKSLQTLEELSKQQSQMGTIVRTPQQEKEMKKRFLSAKMKFDANDVNATGVGLEKSLKDIKATKGVLSKAEIGQAERIYKRAINNLNYRTYKTLDEEVKLAGVDLRPYDDTKKLITNAYERKDITKAKKDELLFNLDRLTRKQPIDKDALYKEKLKKVEEFVGFIKNKTLNKLSSKDNLSSYVMPLEQFNTIIDTEFPELSYKDKSKYKENFANFYKKYHRGEKKSKDKYDNMYNENTGYELDVAFGNIAKGNMSKEQKEEALNKLLYKLNHTTFPVKRIETHYRQMYEFTYSMVHEEDTKEKVIMDSSVKSIYNGILSDIAKYAKDRKSDEYKKAIGRLSAFYKNYGEMLKAFGQSKEASPNTTRGDIVKTYFGSSSNFVKDINKIDADKIRMVGINNVTYNNANKKYFKRIANNAILKAKSKNNNSNTYEPYWKNLKLEAIK